MGAEEIRVAVADYFAPPVVIGLNKVFKAMPYWAGGDEWEFDVDNAWAAVGYVHLTQDAERRIGLGGAEGGQKMVTYTVGLVLLFKCLIPDPMPIELDADWYVSFLDQLIDDVKDRIRADRTFGCGTDGPVWQAAEGDGVNTPDLRVQRDLPRLKGGMVQSWQVVEFTLDEVVFA